MPARARCMWSNSELNSMPSINLYYVLASQFWMHYHLCCHAVVPVVFVALLGWLNQEARAQEQKRRAHHAAVSRQLLCLCS